MQNTTREFLHDPRRRLVAKLLMHELPKMQPSALKHEYLTSVANAVNNPVATSIEDDGATRIVAFGDVNRTLPLMVIQNEDSSVRHAFVPNIRDPRDQPLLEELQKHEDEWTAERGVPSRDILAELRLRHREEINRHGLNRYLPRTPFNDADIEAMQTGKWYPTRPIEADVEFSERPDRSQPEHRERLEANIARSADMSLGARSKVRIMGATLAHTRGHGTPMAVESLQGGRATPDEGMSL